MALALLLSRWGLPTALIVDHGLRDGSAAEAALTARRLMDRGVDARVLPRLILRTGAGLAARARTARYAALAAACKALGLVDLFVAHHRQDQAETLLLRRAAGSGSAGLAGMAVVSPGDDIRLLRPLLTIPPDRLRATLTAAGLAWVDDPSNVDPATPRARLRADFAQGDVERLARLAHDGGTDRGLAEQGAAARLAETVTVLPSGVAWVASPSLSAPELSALIWTVSGRTYPPRTASVRQLTQLRSATLHGAAIVMGRGGWWIGREAAAMGRPVPATLPWDGRFCLAGDAPGCTIGALGDDAARLRRWSDLPSMLVRTLPALRRDRALFAVPHLHYPDIQTCRAVPIVFRPARPVAPAPFTVA
ncbi:MAG: tRNA lysidine(34) synthetase TilS [Gemmatimonadaceae bacterium]|nr:tRNA lysidine(34) synthetase TilS [Acetobacteraceae bacterium]